MASTSSGTRLWRTTFLTLRDETLASPEPPALLSLLRRLLLSAPPNSLVSGAGLLPPHEVTSDVVFLTDMGISVSTCGGSDDVLHFILHLIHSITSKVCLDINASSWSTLLNFLEAIFAHFDKNSSQKNSSIVGSGTVSTATDSIAIVSSMVKVYERNATLSEYVQLTGVLLSIISILHVELLNINQSGDSGFVNLKRSDLWGMQTTTFSHLGKVLAQIGSTMSTDLWQSIIEVLRKVMDFLASNNLVIEDNVISRFLSAFLHSLHLVLSDPKGPLASHMAGFVPTLQLFFMYGVSAVSTTSELKERRSSSLEMKSGMTSRATSTAYKPPHLRRKEAFKNSNSSDSESSSRYDFSSSDSDHSDTDTHAKGGDRYRSSKTRLNAIYCIQDLCRADAKSLTSFWPLLLPENDVIQPRKNHGTLMTSLIFDPIIKVRVEAVSAIVTMLEGQALVLSQVAEYKESSKPGSFTTLSSSLGRILMQLHAGVLYLIQRETHTTLVASLYKLLVILISVTPYGRMPSELLPTVISSLCNRISRNDVLKKEHYALVVNVLSCLEMAFSKSPPSVDVLKLLEGSLQGVVVDEESSVFTMLFTCLEMDMHLNIKCEALQVLKAIYHNYPSTVSATWRRVSNVVYELLHMRNFDEPTFYRSKGDVDKNALPTFERCIASVIKVMDECLRAASGFQGADDRLEFRLMDIQQVTDKTRTKRVSSAPCFELEQSSITLNNQSEVDISVGVALWNEAVERHLPVALSHSSPSVKAASVTCFAGMTSAVFFSLTREKQEFVIFSSIGAATKEAVPPLRSAACRAIGIISSFPPIITDSRVLCDFIHAVELNTRNQLASVRITASWALANICDSVRLSAAEFCRENVPLDKPTILLVESALRLAKDGDKIKSNAVRALGYLSRFIRFDDLSRAHNDLSLPSNGDSNLLERMVQAFLSCVTTGNVKVQWNVCHALSNLFMNDTLNLQKMSWAPTVFRVLLLLIRDSTNYKIRIHAAVALAVPASRTDYGNSFSDVVQGILQVLELLSSDNLPNPSSYKYRDNLEKQLAFTALHMLALISSEEDQSLKDFLIKKAAFLEDWLKPLCSSFNDEINQPSSSNDNKSSEVRDQEAHLYVTNKNILLKSLETLYNIYESSRHHIVAIRFEKLANILS